MLGPRAPPLPVMGAGRGWYPGCSGTGREGGGKWGLSAEEGSWDSVPIWLVFEMIELDFLLKQERLTRPSGGGWGGSFSNCWRKWGLESVPFDKEGSVKN